jgi:hypothetical protein
MNHVDEKIKRKLMKLIGGPSKDELDVDEILSLMLQISFALMMIFMIAFFLFRAKVVPELEQVESSRKQQLVSEQRQKLIVGQGKFEDYLRTQYGLKVFAVANSSMNITYDSTGLVKNGKLITNSARKLAFVNGSAAAFKDFASPDKLYKKWYDNILSSAQLNDNDLLEENRQWLKKEIKISTEGIRKDCEEIQTQVAAEVQEYFVKKPQSLNDSDVKKLLQRFTRANTRERDLIIPELSILLRKHVFEYIRTQTGTPMLEKLK